MDVAGLITQYGYVAVALGTFFEGEAALLLAGVAAWRTQLALPIVVLVAIVATFVSDFAHYYAGRRYGTALLSKYPSLGMRADRVHRLMHRHHLPLILSMRFMYGLRSAGLVALGISGVPMVRFAMLNLLSVIVWAIGVAGIGYYFGGATYRLFGAMEGYQLWPAVGFLVLSLACLLLRRRRAAAADRRRKSGSGDGDFSTRHS